MRRDVLSAEASVTELRKDPASHRWVLVQLQLAAHPQVAEAPCPFCPGREDSAPPEIAAYRTNGQPSNSASWLVRVIPERSPLFHIEERIRREGLGMFDRVSTRGASEILVEHPDHDASWCTMSTSEIERILWMYRQRIEDLYRDHQIRSILVYRRDHRPGADIPNPHPLSRILGAPIVFDDLREELGISREHYARKQRCLRCDILQQELHDEARLVARTPHFLVYAPYASRRPYEVCVAPLLHSHRFENISAPAVADLARALQATIRRLRSLCPSEPLEMILRTAPNAIMRLRDDEWQTLSEDYHWHIELAPIRTGSHRIGGLHIVPIAPEAAANRLRAVTS